ncbi:oligogalacturonate-specific porin KdgM family protein [Cronobacter muytjensii]|uniref:Porin n=1 Tax=Cronobacter muytjensii TaxID=413501 RepID=A0A2T7APJ0_9ENTR|nr:MULTISPECIES: oligogalacturonate-specific porin KdgM family protein [Cronobacter]ALB69524.1 porin [Cronobacter muytjensii ATCC 51329]EGT4337998.1 porin [Cronobacter muytjensii]EKS1843270.1 porin [Cronobacter muytjensii]ELY2495452.1 porin [Cronobacter muytjensii]ELY3984083.1 porin [Cronobacter muytjensii]
MFKKALALAVLCGSSFAAHAVTVDLRHEYIDSGTNADRVAVSHRFDNGLGFSVEAKWKTGGDDQSRPFNEVVGNGHEDQISWRWKATDAIAVTPAFTIESVDSKTIYKPNIHVQYSFDNGVYIAARYRYEYTRVPEGKDDDDKVNRGDAWVGFALGDWRTELNYVYAQSEEGFTRNNGKKYSNEYNAKVAYKIDKNWSPYFEVGNIGVKETDERQTRLRVGVAYSF